jgi:EAL domain-containing protein (putative c-di-GMP-specific phosphodiesterase class I)/DNA-binding response OmpR family regulator
MSLGACVLCIEDEPSLRRDLVDELRDAGYRVIEAADGLQGYDMLEREQPDLVLCDISMPGMNGLELLQKLRGSQLANAQVPFVFLTAHGQKHELIRGHDLGADDYLVKPVDFDLLLSLLRSRLRGVRRARHDLYSELQLALEQVDTLSRASLAERSDPRIDLDTVLEQAVAPVELLLAVSTERGFGSSDHAQAEAANALLAALPPAEALADPRCYRLPSGALAVVLMRPASVAPGGADEATRLLRLQAMATSLQKTVVLAPLVPGTGVSISGFVDEAMMALHQAVRDRISELLVLTPSASDRLRLERHIEASLVKAIERGELFLQYEPKVRLADRQVLGVEALVRWRCPDFGLIAPGLFIPLIERSGQIGLLTDWVLDEALRELAVLRQQNQPLLMAVNISASDLKGNLPARIDAALERHGVPPSSLEVEITETAVIRDIERAADVMAQLRQRGVRVSIDDFGTGHASLTYLRTFPIDSIKIDRLFVQHIDAQPVDQAIVRGVLSLAQSLGLRVVAEGVEDRSQLDRLRELGCEQAQGYYFSRPMTAVQLEHYLRNDADGAD